MIDTYALKEKVIELAIQGKLTNQLPSDGDAADLLSQIQTEKDRKQDRINKRKANFVVEEDVPFEIPKNWKWAHLGEVCQLSDGEKKETKHLPVLSVLFLRGKASATYSDNGRFASRESNLILVDGENSGEVFSSLIDGYIGSTFKLLQISPVVNEEYIIRFIDFNRKLLKKSKTGSAIPHLNKELFFSLFLPLPPLSEQKRIVEKINQIFVEINVIDSLQQQYEVNREALKGKIIDAGIRGKLTEQLTEDGNADDLYAQIQEEKAKIIESRGGRKDKSIKAEDEDKPFIIPDSWKWIRLGEVGLFKKGPFGSALTKSMFVPKSDDAVKVYEQQHAIKKNARLGMYYISREYYESAMTGFEVKSGDIIVSCAGTIGESYIMPSEIEQGIINQALMRVTLVPSIVDKFFLFYFDSNLKSNAQNESNGMAIKNIPPFDVMKNWYFPLPPLEEQKRIVSIIESLLNQLAT